MYYLIITFMVTDLRVRSTARCLVDISSKKCTDTM
jgi:hypothetical protein